MDAVSYPNPKVIEFFTRYLIPVRVQIDSKPLPQQFKVQWTPTLVLLDQKGEEHHRTVGYLAPEELLPSLMLGVAKSYFDREEYPDAEKVLQELLAEYPKSDAAPEATYYLGVSRYKRTHDAENLKKTVQAIQRDYPHSEWAKRSSVYSLL
ncbi:MAG TPA: tetratricopeptide repeat protein [Clostridia bacterium]|nr:tetratricopeptide repeat protein [Clostridia bacterium]